MSNPAPTLNQINAFNATQGTTIDFNIIGGTEVIRSNKIYIYDLSDNSLICTHLYVSTESIHELPPNTSSSIVYASGKSSADFTNNTQYYAQIQTFTDVGGTQGGSGLSIAKLFWCLPTPTLTLSTIPTTISTTSYNVSATYTPNTSGSATNEIQEFQFNLYSAIGALLQTSGVVLYGEGVDLSYNFSGLEVDSTYYVTLDVTTTQGMNVSAQSNTFTVSIDTPTIGSASVVNNGCDGYISVTSSLSSEYEHEESSEAGEIMSFTTDSVNDIIELDVDFEPAQDGTPWMSAKNTEPYTFRVVPTQTEDFGHESDTIVGGTVAWNQKVVNGNFESTSDWNLLKPATGSISANNNILTHTITGGESHPSWWYGLSHNAVFDNIDHKYLCSIDVKPSVASTFRVEYGGVVRLNVLNNLPANTKTTLACIAKPGTYNNTFLIYPQNAVADVVAPAMTIEYSNVNVFDLTQMFGTTIADYIYSLETATAGAGVAWFKKLFPKPYYAYNAGQLMSVKTSAHQMVGFNQLDPANTKIGGAYNPTVGNTINLDSTGATYTGTNPIEINVTTSWRGCCLISEPLVAGQQYEVAFKTSAPTTADKRISQYLIDADNRVITSPYNWVGNNGDNITRTFTPTESGLRCAVAIQSTSAQKITVTDPCVHLRWDGERDGEYEEYVKHSYPLDSSLTLRGIPKLDASNNLYYDGDIYHADGSVDRRYGIVDLGTLSWYKLSNGVMQSEGLTDCKYPTSWSAIPNILCSQYQTITPNQMATASIDKSVCISPQSRLNVYDTNYIDATAFTTAMSGVYLVYEKATPTTSYADPYTNPQIVDPHGTEQYVGSPIPVGHETTYQRICPITGWTGCEVDVAGVNVWDEEWVLGYWDYQNNGAFVPNSGFFACKNKIPVLPNTAYYWKTPSVTREMLLYDGDGNYISRLPIGGTVSSIVITTTSNCRYVTFYYSGAYGTTYNDDISINYPSTDHDYHAYNGQTYTSTFPKYKQQVSQDKTPYITKNIGDTYADTLTENLVGGTIAWNQSVPDTTTTHTVSGSIASMDDAVVGNFESVVCDITPVQDLHGYDKPWVGGAGKNKLQNASDSYSISGATYHTYTVSNLSAYSSLEMTFSIVTTDIKGKRIALYKNGDLIKVGNFGSKYVTATMPTLLDTDSLRLYLQDYTADAVAITGAQLELGSAQTSWTPYSNLCPITGWTGCEVNVCGVNLFNKDASGILADKYLAIDGTVGSVGGGSSVSDYIEVKGGQTYFASQFVTTSVARYCCWYDEDKIFISSFQTILSPTTITAPNNAKYLRISFYTAQLDYIYINYPSTDHDYHAYQGTTYPVSWQTEAGTVYGGSIDVVSGVLTVDRIGYVFDGDEAWSCANNRAVIALQNAPTGSYSRGFISNYLTPSVATTSSPSPWEAIINSSGTLLIGTEGIDSLEEWETYLSANPLQVVYKLAQAQTYQLDPVQVACLLGQNNVWNNISNTSVTYPTNHSYQSLSTTHKYYKRINGVESISVGSDVVADVGTDNIIDLTQMFGTTIADYIYNREQSSSSGMGVKFFKSLFPNDDYDYNSGELISVKASAHVIKDANGNVLHTYPLDSDLVLRGIPKLDANDKLYYDGDVYQPNGSVTRKYGIVDLGTLSWSKYNASSDVYGEHYIYATTGLNGANFAGALATVTCITNKYVGASNVTSNAAAWQRGDKTCCMLINGDKRLYVRDDSLINKTPAEFKIAMSGVMLVYELNAPTTEQADPFEENQAIVSNGVEEYIVTEQGDVEMPVGHDSTYYAIEVYGGTIDMVSGVLTINMASVGLGTLDYSYYGNGIFYHNLNGRASGGQNLICNAYPTSNVQSWSSIEDKAVVGNIANGYIYIRDTNYTDVTTFKNAMNGVQLVYELATPQTYQLTPQQMQTLSGQNNVWSNTNGGMYLVYQLPITSLLVKRRDVADVSGKWLTLYSTPITQASDMDFTFIDFLNQYGKTYQYALVPVLEQDQSGVVVQIEGGYTVSDNVDSIFDGVYIADQTNVERVKAGAGYGNIDMNQGVGSITPIGSKYPIVITNSQNQYHNGSIRGTIVPNDFYSNGNLSRIDMVNKRDELEQFLTNKRAKIIKDWNGKIWLVMIMSNVSCSFDDNYGMGMVSFSADWLEVGDPTNQQDLYNAGLINVGGV